MLVRHTALRAHSQRTGHTMADRFTAFKEAARQIAGVRDRKSELQKQIAVLTREERKYMKTVIDYMRENNVNEIKLKAPYGGRIVLEEHTGRKGITEDLIANVARDVIGANNAPVLAKRIIESRPEVTRYSIRRVPEAGNETQPVAEAEGVVEES